MDDNVFFIILCCVYVVNLIMAQEGQIGVREARWKIIIIIQTSNNKIMN